MELHERWLVELRSERMKNKTAFAEGKITDEEYMNNKEIGSYLEFLLGKRQQYKEDLASGKISPEEHKKFLDEIHAANNCPIRNNFNQRYGATGRERQFIEAGKLINGEERVLVIVPHGTAEELNTNSIKFWNLQDIIFYADLQKNPEEAELKNPYYKLVDPTFDEKRDPTGFIQKEMEEADIVLSLNSHDQWVILKTPHQKLDNNYLWILKIPEVSLDDLFSTNPKEVWVYADHRLGYTSDCENLYHGFADNLAKVKPDIKLHLISGHPSNEWMSDKEIVLMADRFGFLVKHAPHTSHLGKVVLAGELISADYPLYQHLYFGDSTLTSMCRTEFSREVKPLTPYEDPGHAYTLFVQSERAKLDLENIDISSAYPKPGKYKGSTDISDLRFNYLFLTEFKEKDDSTGISFRTFEKLSETTGLDKNDLIQHGLLLVIKTLVPDYEPDEGPLTEEQFNKIVELCQVNQNSDESFKLPLKIVK